MAKREPWNPLLKSYPESEKINSVSPAAEALYCRLIALSDDMASYYGDIRLIASYTFGHRLENRTATVPKIAIWRNELLCAGLLELFIANGREYIHIINCKKHLRSDILPDIRFPDITEENTISELSSEILKATRRIRDCKRTYPPYTNTNTNTNTDTYTEAFLEWWKIYRRKVNKAGAFKAWRARLGAGILGKLLFDCLRNYNKHLDIEKTEERYILHAATFLGPSKRYEDYAPGEWTPPKDPNANDDPYGEKAWENHDEEADEKRGQEVRARNARRRAERGETLGPPPTGT